MTNEEIIAEFKKLGVEVVESYRRVDWEEISEEVWDAYDTFKAEHNDVITPYLKGSK